jgi:hypothetical protein
MISVGMLSAVILSVLASLNVPNFKTHLVLIKFLRTLKNIFFIINKIALVRTPITQKLMVLRLLEKAI